MLLYYPFDRFLCFFSKTLLSFTDVPKINRCLPLKSHKSDVIRMVASCSPTGTPGLPLLHTSVLAVAGHCRDATALHGRQRSLWQMEGADRGVERGQRTRSSLNARSTCRPPRFPRNLATYRRRVVRELLSHYNNDPLHIMRKLIRAALRWTRVCVRLCCGTAAGRTALGRRRFQLLPGAACASAGRCSGPGSGIARQQAHAQMPRRCEALKRPPPEFHSSGTTASRQYAC